MSISSVVPGAAPQVAQPAPALPAQSAGSAAAPAAADALQRGANTAEAGNKVLASNGANLAVDSQTLRQALEDVQAAIKPVANELTFSIDEDSGRTLIKIVDSQTDELIRQIPSEELVRISKALDKLQGLLLKQEA